MSVRFEQFESCTPRPGGSMLAFVKMLAWAVVCKFRGHSWEPWRPDPYAHLLDVARCRCGIERTRRRGLVNGHPDHRAIRRIQEARGGTS